MKISHEQLLNIAYNGYDKEVMRSYKSGGKHDIDGTIKGVYCKTCDTHETCLSYLTLSTIAYLHEGHELEV